MLGYRADKPGVQIILNLEGVEDSLDQALQKVCYDFFRGEVEPWLDSLWDVASKGSDCIPIKDQATLFGRLLVDIEGVVNQFRQDRTVMESQWGELSEEEFKAMLRRLVGPQEGDDAPSPA